MLKQMATAAVIGLSSGARFLGSSFYHSDPTEKFYYLTDQSPVACGKNAVAARKTCCQYGSGFHPSKRTEPIKAFQEHVDGVSTTASTAEPSLVISESIDEEMWESETCVDALLLLQKSMLEKQWNLSFEHRSTTLVDTENTEKKMHITSSGKRARIRRMNNRRISASRVHAVPKKSFGVVISPELRQIRSTGYVRGVTSEEYLTHAEVARLSQMIKAGLAVEKQRSRLTSKLGYEPSEEELAKSLRMNRAELRSKLIECSLAREKLAMSNVRLVMSIAQKFENMGAEMGDLVQGGLFGLLRGIEKFDSSKGFKISTYVYWWIRQGITRALLDNSRLIRLPNHLNERLNLIRGATLRLQQKGITPSVDRIAESLNISNKKVKNAMEAIRHVFSLDRDAFPALGGLPEETYHSYTVDNRPENNPWHGVVEWARKEEVNQLINTTLDERERHIIHLYFGFGGVNCLSWEDIGKGIGLSRERVRQVGLVALEKLKHAARKQKLEAMLVKH